MKGRRGNRFLRRTHGYGLYMSKGWGWWFLAGFAVWTFFAVQWTEVGCDYPEAYLAVIRFGTPEGLEFLPACAG
ncbi:hypothetical protein SNE510_66920 [Streptomyces sp. NE5-10]|nr:hypothetical protein SNE510_66920 [Streptomyces sp. NE5-10]